jgi:hypothetical protein
MHEESTLIPCACGCGTLIPPLRSDGKPRRFVASHYGRIAERSPLWKRLWLRVDRNGPIPEYRPDLGPCWLWTGSKNDRGYGQFYMNTRQSKQILHYAHRVVYELLRRVSIPNGLELDHLCRVRSCVNPWHLEPVTTAENSYRGFSPTAINARKTHCIHGHPLTSDNVYVHPVKGGRQCLICKRERERLHRERHPRPSQAKPKQPTPQ